MEPGVPLNVLFVVPYAPTRIRTRPFHLIRTLADAGHRVTVATLWSTAEEHEAIAGLEPHVAGVITERLPLARSAWNCARALTGRDPMQAHYSWLPRFARRLQTAVEQERFDVVHVEHLRGVRYGLGLAGRRREARPAMVWDSVDCITSLFRRAAQESPVRRVRLAARLELRRTERFEAAAACRFDRVLVTSEVDRRELVALRHDNGGGVAADRVCVLPNGVDLAYFAPVHQPRDPLSIVITGKMSYHANVTAVVRFVTDVMPAVWAQMPGVCLSIVGKDPAPEVLRLASEGGNGHAGRIVVTGTVDDLRPFLRSAALAVAPIQYGVGIQNKVLEAMACATPLVATPEAVSALNIRPGEDVGVAGTPAEMVSTLTGLLREPAARTRLGLAGRSFVEQRHDWRGLGARLTEIYLNACH